jgi:hypothetical protein
MSTTRDKVRALEREAPNQVVVLRGTCRAADMNTEGRFKIKGVNDELGLAKAPLIGANGLDELIGRELVRPVERTSRQRWLELVDLPGTRLALSEGTG